MREAVLCAQLAAAATLVATAAPARAAGEPPASEADAASAISGIGACPAPSAVWAELVTLIPHDRLAARLHALGTGAGPAIELADLGGRYRVAAAGRTREYRDDARECAHRARVAALFVALAIDPAEIGPAEIGAEPPAVPVTVVAQPAVSPPAAESAAKRPPRLRLELGGAVDAGGGPDERVVHAGLELRVAAGRGRLGFVAGLGALAPADTSVGGLRVWEWRLPLDAGLRLSFGGQRFAGYGEVGAGAALLVERGLDLAGPRTQTGLELGARAALGARMATRGRLEPFAVLAAELVPDPPSVFALPVGVAGRTPLVWIGLTAGASLGLETAHARAEPP